jgi:hypothetical protein
LTEADTESLTKANKNALKAIADFIKAEKTWHIVGALCPYTSTCDIIVFLIGEYDEIE